MSGEIGPDALDLELRGRLAESAARISAKVTEFEKQGATHGAEREALADRKLQQLSFTEAHSVIHDLAADVEILRLNLERLLARIDKGS